MKLFVQLFFLSLIINFSLTSSSHASNLIDSERMVNEINPKKNGGIFSINLRIAPELTTEGSFGRVSWSTEMTSEQKESILKLIEASCSEKLDANVESIYKVNKKGERVTSLGTSGSVSGMPTNTFKNTVLNNDKELFIKVDIYITNDGKPIMVEKKKSIIKPKVSGYIKVYDKDKNVVYSHKFSKNSLGGIISLNSKNEPLSPENSYIIIEDAVAELMKG